MMKIEGVTVHDTTVETLQGSLSEVQQRLADNVTVFAKFAREIGEKLHDYAVDNDLCEEYDTWLTSGFSPDVRETRGYEVFLEAAKVERTVRRTVSLSVTVHATPVDFEYDSLSFRATHTVDGVYKMNQDTHISCLDDLYQEDVEFVDGTDLQEWFEGVTRIDLEIEATEEGVEMQ